MIRLDSPSIRHLRPLLAAIATLALVAACSPASGPLGTPSSPAPTDEGSLPVASGDATPDLSSPSPSASGEPSTGPSSSVSPSGTPAASPSSAATPKPTAAPTATPAGTVIVRAYFLMPTGNGEGLVPVLREVPATKAVATAAMRALLAGPNTTESSASPALSSAIPDGTTLLGITIADRVATVDLSAEFASGGGSASMQGRLAQVVYTLTQFPTVDAVRFALDGVPTTVFGGEGVTAPSPVGRDGFRDQLPAIFVDRPAWGAALGSGTAVSGVANVFEATFRLRLMDASGAKLVDTQVMASCGTGCWGTFKVSVAYTVTRGQWGTLRVYNLSAKDGTPEDIRDYPVWLTPGG